MPTKKTVIAVILTTIWISISEFIRNEFLFKSYWVNHFQSLGLTFPDSPLNGAVWGLWSLCFAVGIFVLSKSLSFKKTVLTAWLFGFVLMWLVIGNLGVLPIGLLLFAVPLSLLEVSVAVLIIRKVSNSN